MVANIMTQSQQQKLKSSEWILELMIKSEYILCKCGFKADIIDNKVHYCAECWSKKFLNKTLDELKEQQKKRIE